MVGSNNLSSICYESFTPRMVEDVARLIASAFTRDEPMTRCRGISADTFVRRFIAEARWFAEKGDSIVARECAEGQVVGVALIKDFALVPNGKSAQINEQFAPIFALLHALDARYCRDKEIGEGEYLEISMLASKKAYRGRGIGEELVRLGLEQGRRQGYRIAVAQATGQASQRLLCKKHGFVSRNRIDYGSFTHDGQRVFAAIQEPRNAVFVEKRLHV